MDYLAILLGFTVSFFVGLTGMGGGALMTPALIFLGIPPRVAIGTDLLYAAVTRLLGSGLHFRKGNVNVRLAFTLLLGSIPGSIISGAVMKVIGENYGYGVLDVYLMNILGITLITVSLITLYKAIAREQTGGEHPSTLILILVGFFVGGVVQLTSVGSGILVTLFLLAFTRMYPRTIVGTDILYGFLLTSFATLIHFTMGNVDFDLASMLILGAIPGTYLGVLFNSKIDEKPLRVILALIVFLSGAALLLKGF
jgi:hypothetical protein